MQDLRYVKKCDLMLKCYDEAGDSTRQVQLGIFYAQTDLVT